MTKKKRPSSTSGTTIFRHMEHVAGSLTVLAERIKELQHHRAAAGGGCPANWQNAMRYIEQAVEALETQARLDAERSDANTPG